MLTGTSRFGALGTYVHLSTRCASELSTAEKVAREVLTDIDETCSRFRSDSDLTNVNQHAGVWVQADPLLVHAIQAACIAAEVTNGLVNPLLGASLVQLGYDRDFGLLAENDDPTPRLLGPGPGTESWRQIELDRTGGVRIPANTALDLGSTAKAWAADLIAAAFAEELHHGALISLGGDIAIALPGKPADAQTWDVAISEKHDQPADQTIALLSGGLATSSTQVRHWRRDGVLRHHLLDPRTGLPCDAVWRTVTATAQTCLAANTASTVAIVLGHQAANWLHTHGIDARLVAEDGKVHHTGQWPTSASLTAVLATPMGERNVG